MRTLGAGALYFVLVFAAGWVLGPIRELLVVPRWGQTVGLALEAPLMLAAIVLAASWVVRRLTVPPVAAVRSGMGLIALVLLLVAEDVMTRAMRGASIWAVWAGYDQVAGTINILLLLLFAAMPLLVGRRAGAT
jgi:hypothetical protein